MVRVFSQVAVPYLSCETGKIRLFWRSAHSRRGSCCPIENHEISEAPMFPHRGPQDSEKPDKTMAPAMKIREITQQKMYKQSGPYSPADSIFVIAEKVCQLQSLLDLLENTSISHRQRYNSAMLHALHSMWSDRNVSLVGLPLISTIATIRRNTSG